MQANASGRGAAVAPSALLHLAIAAWGCDWHTEGGRPKMARPRERVCLEQGLKLDLVRLARHGLIRLGANVGPRGIQWKKRAHAFSRKTDRYTRAPKKPD